MSQQLAQMTSQRRKSFGYACQTSRLQQEAQSKLLKLNGAPETIYKNR